MNKLIVKKRFFTRSLIFEGYDVDISKYTIFWNQEVCRVSKKDRIFFKFNINSGINYEAGCSYELKKNIGCQYKDELLVDGLPVLKINRVPDIFSILYNYIVIKDESSGVSFTFKYSVFMIFPRKLYVQWDGEIDEDRLIMILLWAWVLVDYTSTDRGY